MLDIDRSINKILGKRKTVSFVAPNNRTSKKARRVLYLARSSAFFPFTQSSGASHSRTKGLLHIDTVKRLQIPGQATTPLGSGKPVHKEEEFK